jgi:hypothetical protein
VGVNITLSVPEEVVERARAVAQAQGTSLNALIRQYLERLGGIRANEEVLQALEEHWASQSGSSGGEPFRRDDLYAERLK